MGTAIELAAHRGLMVVAGWSVPGIESRTPSMTSTGHWATLAILGLGERVISRCRRWTAPTGWCSTARSTTSSSCARNCVGSDRRSTATRIRKWCWPPGPSGIRRGAVQRHVRRGAGRHEQPNGVRRPGSTGHQATVYMERLVGHGSGLGTEAVANFPDYARANLQLVQDFLVDESSAMRPMHLLDGVVPVPLVTTCSGRSANVPIHPGPVVGGRHRMSSNPCPGMKQCSGSAPAHPLRHCACDRTCRSAVASPAASIPRASCRS